MEKAIELAQWLDHVKGEPPVKEEALQDIDAKTTRELIAIQLRYIGSLFREWMNQSSLSPTEKSILHSILKNKFI